MPHYCFYILGSDGHIRSRVDMEYVDDKVALQTANRLVDGGEYYALEIWDQARCVGRIGQIPASPTGLTANRKQSA